MKSLVEKLRKSGIFMFLTLFVCSMIGVVDAGAMCAEGAGALDDGSDSGAVITDEPLSLQQMMLKSPKLTREAFHEEVTLVDSYNHIFESTLASKRVWDKKRASAHTVNVPTLAATPVKLMVPSFEYEKAAVKDVTLDLGSANNEKVKKCQTLILPQVRGYKDDHVTVDDRALVLVVKDKNTNGTLVVNAINGVKAGSVDSTVPDIAETTNFVVLRGKQLASEKQIRTGLTGGVPTMKPFYIRKTILETEETTWGRLTEKNIRWTEADNLRFALNERKNEGDSDFYLGVGRQIGDYANAHNNNRPDLAYTNEGILWMAGKEFDFGGSFNVSKLIDAMDESYSDNNGAPTRYVYMGRNFQKAFAQLLFPTGAAIALGKVYEDEKLKIRYKSIEYMGGKEWLIVHEPALDSIGLPDVALLVDINNGFQYNFGDPRVIELDHVKNGESDSKGQVIVDEEANILTNSNTHMIMFLNKSQSLLSWMA